MKALMWVAPWVLAGVMIGRFAMADEPEAKVQVQYYRPLISESSAGHRYYGRGQAVWLSDAKINAALSFEGEDVFGEKNGFKYLDHTIYHPRLVATHSERPHDDAMGWHDLHVIPLIPKSVTASLASAIMDLADLEDRVQREELRVGQELAKQLGLHPLPRPDLQGRVLSVAEDGKTVVLSVTFDDGVSEGDDLVVSRGEDYVTTVRVKTADEQRSTAVSVEPLQKVPLRVGDTVLSR